MVATTAAAVAAASVGGSPAAEAAAPRQAGTIVYTSTAPRTATGLAASFEFQNPENPSLKPHAVATLVMHGPAGATIDTTVPAQCHASDAELMIEGPVACPPDSKVVSGLVVADTGGGAGPFP